MKKGQKSHFVFDVDDTLADSYEFNQQMFVDTFAPYVDLSNLEVEKYLRELHRSGRGTAMVLQFEEAIKHLGAEISSSELVRINELLHIDNVSKLRIFDSAVEVITKLKFLGCDVSVCSNRQLGSLDKIIEKHAIKGLFTNIISCADAGHEKPDPHCLNMLIKDSGKDKSEFIYFGDSKTDFQFAANAGIDCIIVDHYLNQKKFYQMILQFFL